MAAAPPLLLSVLLVLSLSSISYCSDEGTTNPPTTSKDAVIQYWNLQFPNKPLPSFFLSKLSPLSPLQLMATANYDSGARGNHVTANYGSKAQGNHTTANYDSGARGNHLTANYGSKAQGNHHTTANYDSGARGNHLTANYRSKAQGNHTTANYDSGARGNRLTANYGSKAQGNHTTANYDSGARGNRLTANYRSKAQGNHTTANYASGARGNHLTANYGSKAQGNHTTANYDSGARGNHLTANYRSKPSRKAYKVHATANNIRMVTGDDATGKVAKRSSNLNVFFRESNLTRGTIMPMCDIKATMPQMPLLPRSIATMLPFSSPHEVKKHFRIPENSRMSKDIDNTISNCNSAPSKGETKACLTSAEDIIDFIRLNLGPTATLKNTESAEGSEGDIIIGEVKSVKGDKLTELVACHEVVFPYMVYLCHSVPKVKMYEAEILDVESKEKINHGIAICHFDTSNWSEGHVVFVELGFKPGEIEACHWMFEGEMAAFAE